MNNKEMDKKKLAEEYRERAMKAYEEQNPTETVTLFQEAAQLYKECEEYYAYAQCLNFLGIVYSSMGDENLAVDYYLEGLECAKDKKVYPAIPLFYNNIGSRYQELGQHKKAIFYFEKSMEALEVEQVKNHPSYDFNHFICQLNLTVSYQHMGDIMTAWKYLRKAEKEFTANEWPEFELPVWVLKCDIYWDKGDKGYIARYVDKLLELSKGLNVVSDYVQNVQQLAKVLKKTQYYEAWKTLLGYVQEVADTQNTVYYRLVSVEMWMEYYRSRGDREKYNRLCIEYAELYRKQKEIEDQERVQALDIRIALKEKEEQRKAAEEKAQTDSLTGLGNRYGLEKDARKMAKEAAQDERLIAVGILDVDCFKEVNDYYGHNVGDAYLKRIGEILRDAVDGYGNAYRFGGDEFVILIPEGDYEAAERIAENIKRKLEEAAIENKQSAVSDYLTLSQGYACFHPRNEERLAGLLEHADLALYKVKESGKNNYRIILEEL